MVAQQLGVVLTGPVLRGRAGDFRRVKKIVLAALAELEALTAALPERYRAPGATRCWCGLRFGELAELRRWTSTPRAA